MTLDGGAESRFLWWSLVIIGVFMCFEVAMAVVSGSLALLADAGHMLTDAGSLAGAIWAASLAARPASRSWTFGLKRAEVLSAAANGTTLLVLAVLVGFEAIRRLISPPRVEGEYLIIVASVGVVANLAATLVLSRANRSSMNVKGAFAHILTDLYAFAGTLAAGVLIVTLGWRFADPTASLLVVVLMVLAAWRLLVMSGRVLLEGTPSAVDLEEVRLHISELADVRSVHELHAWTLSSDLPVLSAHVIVTDECLSSGRVGALLDSLQACLADHFDVEHSTFQFEPASHFDHEMPIHD